MIKSTQSQETLFSGTDKLKTQGYTEIDIGYPAGADLPQSVFYNMEISTLFP